MLGVAPRFLYLTRLWAGDHAVEHNIGSDGPPEEMHVMIAQAYVRERVGGLPRTLIRPDFHLVTALGTE